MAAVLYHPAQAGERTIEAQFKGDKSYAASEASLNVAVSQVIPPFASEPLPLASVGKWLSIGLGILGVAFWGVLLGVLGRTIWGIRTAPGNVAPGPRPTVQTAESSQ
jgi:hypothetical protein